MATIRQIEAARANGRRSRGPVTPEGKARSSQNALRHGIYSKVVVLRSESPELYTQLLDEYLAEYAPVGRREHDAVMQVVNCVWRLNRVLTIETAAIDLRIDRQRPELDRQTISIDEATRAAEAFSSLAGAEGTLAAIGRSESRLLRSIERAELRLHRLQAARKNKKLENEPPAQAA